MNLHRISPKIWRKKKGETEYFIEQFHWWSLCFRWRKKRKRIIL